MAGDFLVQAERGARLDVDGVRVPRRLVVSTKLYVGNLSYDTSNADIEALFAEHGTVQSVQIIEDRATGRSKGFGFVEMGSKSEAEAAIAALDGRSLGGRTIKVNEAQPRAPRPGGGGGGGGRGRSRGW